MWELVGLSLRSIQRLTEGFKICDFATDVWGIYGYCYLLYAIAICISYTSWPHIYISPFRCTAVFLCHWNFLHWRCFCLPYSYTATHVVDSLTFYKMQWYAKQNHLGCNKNWGQSKAVVSDNSYITTYTCD